MKKGKVYIVGAGPGDLELITLKGKRAIEEADVLLYDRLINRELLDFAKKEAKLIYCGKQPKYHHLQQSSINQLLVHYAKQGKVVTRVKGGDPFIYGRGGEEASALTRHGIPFEIVPGVSAGIAAPAYAGIPVTHRGLASSFAVLSGHSQSLETLPWEHYVTIDTLIFYMGVQNLDRIVEALLSHGKAESTPVAIIEWGTTSKQKTVFGSLKTICQKARLYCIANPAIIILGEVVDLHQELAWFHPQEEESQQAFEKEKLV